MKKTLSETILRRSTKIIVKNSRQFILSLSNTIYNFLSPLLMIRIYTQYYIMYRALTFWINNNILYCIFIECDLRSVNVKDNRIPLQMW